MFSICSLQFKLLVSINCRKSQKFSNLSIRMKKHDLKPFKFEKDIERKYDILRSVILENSISGLYRDQQALINDRFSRARKDTSGIENLKKDFPTINTSSVEDLSQRFNVEFKFYTQKSSRFSPVLVQTIGRGEKTINLKIKEFETEGVISFSNLWLLREMEKEAQPCNFLKSKIKKCHSLLDAFKTKDFSHFNDETFYEQWGSLEIKFSQIRQFAKLFGFGIAIWTDESQPSRVRCAYIEKKIDIMVSNDILRKQKLHIHDPFFLVLDSSYIRAFYCKECGIAFKCKRNCSRHEQVCQKGTKYSYKEKKYGHEQNDIKKSLIEKGILSKDDNSEENFVSFDIESLNIPIKIKNGSKTIVKYVQEVIDFI